MVKQESRNGALNNGQQFSERLGIDGEQEAQGKRKGQHPLSDRCLGKYVIDRVGGRLDHPPGTAAGEEPAPFAAERHQVLVTAAVAFYAQEPVFQQSALQVILELLTDELGQAAT